jgi:hypothetical protein
LVWFLPVWPETSSALRERASEGTLDYVYADGMF